MSNKRSPEDWVKGQDAPLPQKKAPQEAEPEQRLTVDIPLSVYKRLKIQSFEEGIMLKELVTRILRKDQEGGK